MSPDRSLIHAILAQGVKGLFIAAKYGIGQEHLFDENRTVYAFMEEFLAKGRVPTILEVQVATGVEIDPEIDGTKIDVETCAKALVKRALGKQLSGGLGKIVDLLKLDPHGARDALTQLLTDSTWSVGRFETLPDKSTVEDIRTLYLTAEQRRGQLLGWGSPWPSMDKASLGLQNGELNILFAKKKLGKSLAANTVVHDPYSGRELTLKELYDNGGSVLTWEKNRPLQIVNPSDFLDSGVKPAVRVTFKSGRSIDAATTHPFLTPGGWIDAGALKIGQHTASVRQWPEPSPLDESDLSEPKIKMLAYMLADGGCTKPSTPTYTKLDQVLVSELTEVARHFGVILRKVKAEDNPTYYLVSDKEEDPFNRGDRLVPFLREHGVMGKKSVDKVIPDAVFGLANPELGLFLGRLWSGDGCVAADGQVSYSTGSHKMALQIQHLLLRFGITSKVRSLSRNTEHGIYYEVLIHRERIEVFKTNVQLIGEKATRLSDVTFKGRSRVGWIRNDEIRGLVEREVAADKSLLKDVGEALGYDFPFQIGHAFPGNSGRVCRKVFEVFCEVYDSELKWILDENIWWDEIESIESIGDIQCYDLSVPPTENFVANDFIVHNTWCKLAWVEHIWNKEMQPDDRILFVSMEMQPRLVYRRFAACHLKLDYEQFRAGTLPEAVKTKFMSWCDDMIAGKMNKPRLTVIGSSEAPSVDALCPIVAQLKPKLLVIDSFYMLQNKGEGQWEKTLGNVQALKVKLANAFDIPVLASTQLKGTVKRDVVEADTDDAAYAKAIGDYADASRGLFGSLDHLRDDRRIWRGLESREFKPVDLLINFNLKTMDFSEIQPLEAGQTGYAKDDDKDDDDDDDRPKSGRSDWDKPKPDKPRGGKKRPPAVEDDDGPILSI